MIGRCSIPLPRITVPDAEAEKQDDMPKKVAPAVLDGHSKPCVHTVGGIVLGVSLDDKKSEVDVQFQFPKDYERYFRLIRCLTTMVSTSSPAICLTVWMGTTCSTNSNMEGKGLPDEDNLASVSTTKRTGRAEAKSQVSVFV